MTITDRDASILSQVAFKAAVETTPEGENVTESDASFRERYAIYEAILVEGVKGAIETHATQVPVQKKYDPEAALRNEMGATDGNAEPTVVGGEKQGPFPPWALKAFAEKGVRRVYDNRGPKLEENPKLPWFKCADTKTPFWPPKGR